MISYLPFSFLPPQATVGAGGRRLGTWTRDARGLWSWKAFGGATVGGAASGGAVGAFGGPVAAAAGAGMGAVGGAVGYTAVQGWNSGYDYVSDHW